MAGQTTWNKATAAAGTDPWNAVPDLKKMLDTAGLVFAVATTAERNGLAALAPGGVLPVPTLVRNAETARYESWNGTRWAQAAITRLGEASHVPPSPKTTLALTPAWTDIASVTATSMGGQVTIDYKINLANADSGADRDAAVRVTCDDVEVDGWTLLCQYVAGKVVPASAPLDVFHTPTAGAHTWKIQGNASLGASVQVFRSSMTVTEKP